jgi:hypothetical protein
MARTRQGVRQDAARVAVRGTLRLPCERRLMGNCDGYSRSQAQPIVVPPAYRKRRSETKKPTNAIKR